MLKVPLGPSPNDPTMPLELQMEVMTPEGMRAFLCNTEIIVQHAGQGSMLQIHSRCCLDLSYHRTGATYMRAHLACCNNYRIFACAVPVELIFPG